jgi:hypothetical protein
MKQAEHTNIIKMPSRIELLWKRHEAAAKEKALVEARDDDDEAALDHEAACDAAYNAVEDIGDEILAAEGVSVTDFAIKARIIKCNAYSSF